MNTTENIKKLIDEINSRKSKNYEQMTSIILTNKVHEYIQIKGLFIRKEFLEN